MKKQSKMYNFSKEEYECFISESSSIRELLKRVGVCDKGNNRHTLFKVLDFYGLNKELEDLKKRSKAEATTRIVNLEFNKFPDELVFCENSRAARKDVKSRIIKRNLIEYKCCICGNNGIHMGIPLKLQLDHINGIGNDNRLENLRFLCPNCHSQTETFSGKKLKIKPSKQEKVINYEKERLIQEKERLIQERKDYLDKTDKTKLGWVMQVAKDWGISWTSVKRWIKRNYPELQYYQRETAVK